MFLIRFISISRIRYWRWSNTFRCCRNTFFTCCSTFCFWLPGSGSLSCSTFLSSPTTSTGGVIDWLIVIGWLLLIVIGWLLLIDCDWLWLIVIDCDWLTVIAVEWFSLLLNVPLIAYHVHRWSNWLIDRLWLIVCDWLIVIDLLWFIDCDRRGLVLSPQHSSHRLPRTQVEWLIVIDWL